MESCVGTKILNTKITFFLGELPPEPPKPPVYIFYTNPNFCNFGAGWFPKIGEIGGEKIL